MPLKLKINAEQIHFCVALFSLSDVRIAFETIYFSYSFPFEQGMFTKNKDMIKKNRGKCLTILCIQIIDNRCEESQPS